MINEREGVCAARSPENSRHGRENGLMQSVRNVKGRVMRESISLKKARIYYIIYVALRSFCRGRWKGRKDLREKGMIFLMRERVCVCGLSPKTGGPFGK